jgi:methionine sulfoxide reductase catalytic subunit
MLIKLRQGWELPERLATSEDTYLNRRKLVRAMGLGVLGMGISTAAFAQAADADPSARLYPAKRNDKYGDPRPLTDEKLATTYNNYYEFGSDKSIWRAAQKLPIHPWTIKIGGLVEKPFEIAFDDLLARMQLEERVYRFRCVETWSMVVPWTGFPLKALVDFAKPLAGAKYLEMKTASLPAVMPGMKEAFYPWPYTDGLAIDEAANELAFIATGLYGKPLPKQDGAPLRLVTPWKYGFKQVKSIVSIDFVEKQPATFWESLASDEYGFWANINPQVAHPRWSQATEKPLGSSERVPTQLYNGYGEQVAGLYANRKAEKLFM